MAKNITPIFSLLICAIFLLSACGDIGITKRRHLPGYHVDFVKTKDQTNTQVASALKADKRSKRIKNTSEELPPAEDDSADYSTVQANPEFEAKFELADQAPLKTTASNETWWALNKFMRNPVKELKQDKLNSEFRRAVFNGEDEKHGWSVLSIISTGLGAVGLGLVITGIVFLASFVFGGGLFYWWIFALLGLLIGIAAMVTGIIAMRKTQSGEKRGRGFALAGMISGIVSLALGLVGLLWGLFYTIISNLGQGN